MSDVRRSADGENGDIYLVEGIIDRRVRRGRVEYRVRWKGFPPEQDSWEPFTSLKEPCLPLIQDFHNRYRKEFQDKRRPTPSSLLPRARSSSRLVPDNLSVDSEDSLKLGGSNILGSNGSGLSDISQHSSRSSRKKADSTICSSGKVSPTPDIVLDHVDVCSMYSGSISINPAGLTASSPPKSVALRLSNSSKLRNESDFVEPSSNLSEAQHTAIPTPPGHGQKRNLLKSSEVFLKRLSPDSSSSAKRSKPSPGPASLTRRRAIHHGSQPAKQVDCSSRTDTNEKSSKHTVSPSDISQQDHSMESGRKSVTIMLKSSPTQEFHSTKDIRPHQSSDSSPPISVGRGKTSRKSDDASTTPCTDSKSPVQIAPDSHAVKVMDVILKLKAARRRPGREAVLALCKRRHNLPETLAVAALNLLVSEQRLHEIPCTSGISYRLDPTHIARGDLIRSNKLSAKIKAKYSTNMTKKKFSSGVKAGCKRPGSRPFGASTHHSKPSRRNGTPGAPFSYGHQHAGKSSFGRSLKPTGTTSYSTLFESTKPENTDSDYHYSGQSQAKHGNSQRFPASSLSHLDSVPNLSQPDQSTMDTNRRTSTASNHDLGYCYGPVSLDRVPGSHGSVSASRRTSVRQTEAVYKFKSIIVRKNITGGFTEVWLQSPGSPLKNAFTIQVLEELTTVLNQAVYDSSRLLMISGMGTVFGSGIDLVSLIGRLPNELLVQNLSSNSSASSSSVSSGNGTGRESSTEPPLSTNSQLKSRPAENTRSALADRKNSTTYLPPVDPIVSQQMCSALRTFMTALLSFPKLVVVGVNGPAMGLAVAMLPLCDLIYVSDTATLQVPYSRLGQTPEGGASYTLANLVGVPVANELLMAGRKLSAREALQRGLASDLLYPKSFKQELIMRCHKLAASSPAALEMTKSLVRSQHREHIEFVVNTECRKLVELWPTERFRRCAIEVLKHEMGDFL